jgi:hypothetical protein
LRKLDIQVKHRSSDTDGIEAKADKGQKGLNLSALAYMRSKP